jgi:hypothetical protein
MRKYILFIKGTLTRDFRSLVISSNSSPIGPCYSGLNLSEYDFEFAKKIDYEIADFGHSGGNDTTVTKNDP